MLYRTNTPDRWYRSFMTRVCNCLVLLTTLAATAVVPAAAGDAPPYRRLLVEVRDTPPQRAGGIRHGADGSYSVSTGAGDTDERANADDNSTTLSTGNSVRRLHIAEGERVRVDLPSVQSLQFHVPVPGGATGKASGKPAATAGAGGVSGAASASGSTGSANAAGSAPSVSGVVTFSAVSAFAARFALAGSTVLVELTPLQVGTVSAPYAAAGAAPAKVIVQGRVGQWISLGDTELSNPRTSLNTTPEPITPGSVWVRVQLDPTEAPQ